MGRQLGEPERIYVRPNGFWRMSKRLDEPSGHERGTVGLGQRKFIDAETRRADPGKGLVQVYR